jgi:hypothetical protein
MDCKRKAQNPPNENEIIRLRWKNPGRKAALRAALEAPEHR